MARNHLEERLEAVRNQQSVYRMKLKELHQEEIEILTELGVFKE